MLTPEQEAQVTLEAETLKTVITFMMNEIGEQVKTDPQTATKRAKAKLTEELLKWTPEQLRTSMHEHAWSTIKKSLFQHILSQISH